MNQVVLIGLRSVAPGRTNRTLRCGSAVTAAITLVLWFSLVVASGSAAVRPNKRGCRSVGSQTVLRTDTLRVFRTPLRYVANTGIPAHKDSVYACWLRTGKRTRLVEESPDSYGPTALIAVKLPDDNSSPMLAYLTSLASRSGNAASLVSLNVRSGRRIHSNRKDVTQYQSAAVNMNVDEFLVTPLGSLAWIGTGNCPGSIDQSTDINGVYAIGADGRGRAEQCGAPNGDAGSSFGPAEFAGLRYATGTKTLSWLSRTGVNTASLS